MAHALPNANCCVFGEMRCVTMSTMLQTRWTWLPALSAVAVTGRDARPFLQGQLTNDLLGLERHPGLLAASCNREGRVLEIVRLAAERNDVLIVVRRALAGALIARLAKFVLRAQVAFEDRAEEFAVAGLLDAEPDRSWTSAAAAATGLAMLVAGSRRILLAGSRAALETTLAAVCTAPPEDWEHASIEDGEPTIHAGTAGLWLPQMLNLDLLGAVSFTKGCYIGQEIVARTQHLGRIKRRMLRYVGPPGTSVEAGQTLYCGDTLAAQVVDAANAPNGLQLLAVVELRFCSSLLGARPGGTELVPADLPYAIPAPETVADA